MTEQSKKSEVAMKNQAGWVETLRSGWEPQPLAHTWRHPLLTAIAVVVCLVLAGILHVRESYWAAISAVVVTQSEVGATVSASRDRFVGTIMGACVGWLTALVWHGNALIFGLAIAVTLILCDVLGLKNAARLAGATICVVALVPATGPQWRTALDRFLTVSLGIAVALIVSVLFYRCVKPRG